MRINPLENSEIRSNKVEEKRKLKKKSKYGKRSVNEPDFFDVFEDAEAEALEKRLNEMVDAIIQAGNDLARSPTKRNLTKYKEKIREFLKFVEKKLYKIADNMDFTADKPRLHVIAEKIDRKLEELTNALLAAERPTLNIMARVGEINGLILDLIR